MSKTGSTFNVLPVFCQFDGSGNRIFEITVELNDVTVVRYNYTIVGLLENTIKYVNDELRFQNSKLHTGNTYRGNKTDPLSLNLYTYCANNPLKYEDPTGHNFITGALSNGAKAVKKAAKTPVSSCMYTSRRNSICRSKIYR